ncbi:tetratricopeptide repeat protein [Sphingomonas morindae]|uniref:Tetratricopeptide repeat protein n=1 Tax=Sphingomonas morindae TaxID=1541170 RepID=A0ABY4X9N7_9SPHN|nr:tetratricopeptide repeat protein [Sphingomonas morindae]USI73652.1 tetratricopeptide repeat protein [Sphingomonas morindae]
MARSPHSNEAFFREVDDEVRREKMTVAARRYGLIAAALVVIGLIAFGGWLFWQHHRDVRAGENGEVLTAAMTALGAGNSAAAKTKLATLEQDGSAGYAALAGVLQADALIRDGKNGDAATKFMAVANDAGAPQPVRDLALVRATALAFDTLPPGTVIARLKPLMVPGTAWFGSAGELTGLAQMKLGQTKEAAQSFAEVAKDRSVPQSLRGRVAQLAADLGRDVQPADSGRS